MPRINTTRTVRIALWALRIYLLILLALIGLKFTRVFSGSAPANRLDPASPTAAPDAARPR
jgi:hypothetical protein